MRRLKNIFCTVAIVLIACIVIHGFPMEDDDPPGEPLPADTGFQSPLELGNVFQGDIELTPDQAAVIRSNPQPKTQDIQGERLMTGLLSGTKHWPKSSKGFVVFPFKFQAGKHTLEQKRLIRVALFELSQRTCITFDELSIFRLMPKDYVEVVTGSGCSSKLGRIGGRQELQLAPGCMVKGIIQHEFIHALGYTHMHNHVDRDKFVKIYFENIIENRKSNFEKVNPVVFGNFGVPYDYLSIMHYTKNAFSKNSKNTIVPKDSKYTEFIGSRKLTDSDVKRVNNMYECKK